MATNDNVLLDGILDELVQDGTFSQRSEAFEFFVFNQTLKNYDLSEEEIRFGMVDGRGDGGFDGLYIFVNGHLLIDPESFTWPKSNAALEIWMMSCKLHSTFRQDAIDKIIATISEIFELGAERQASGIYSPAVKKFRQNLIEAYKKTAARKQTLSINFAYISTGNSRDVGAEVQARANQVEEFTRGQFRNCKCDFVFIGASELIEMHRRVRRFTISLPFIRQMSLGERYVILTRLHDYAKFVTDVDGTVRRYLYDSNVRDFMGTNRVNGDIMATLAEVAPLPDFWWLNNGVTILATAATIIGEVIEIEGVQIVNGLQTTDSIFRHFSEVSGGSSMDERALLVKVIVTDDPAFRDRIIRATNSQTAIETSSLRATEAVQRDIEDILLRHGLYYERRTNFYQNMGIPHRQVVTPLFAARGFICLVLKSPSLALRYKQKHFLSDFNYSAVFETNAPLLVWPTIVRAVVVAERFLAAENVSDRPQRQWLYALVLLAVCRVVGDCGYSAKTLVTFDVALLTDEVLKASWTTIINCASAQPRKFKKVSNVQVMEIFTADIDTFPLKNIGAIESSRRLRLHSTFDNGFIDSVDELLPPQPWPRGIHAQIGRQMQCSAAKVYDAVQRLILLGRRFRQKDGVVFNADGTIRGFDSTRITEAEAHQVQVPDEPNFTDL